MALPFNKFEYNGLRYDIISSFAVGNKTVMLIMKNDKRGATRSWYLGYYEQPIGLGDREVEPDYAHDLHIVSTWTSKPSKAEIRKEADRLFAGTPWFDTPIDFILPIFEMRERINDEIDAQLKASGILLI